MNTRLTVVEVVTAVDSTVVLRVAQGAILFGLECRSCTVIIYRRSTGWIITVQVQEILRVHLVQGFDLTPDLDGYDLMGEWGQQDSVVPYSPPQGGSRGAVKYLV